MACECLKLQPFLGNVDHQTQIIRIRIIEQGFLNVEKLRKDITEIKYPNSKTQKNFPLLPIDYTSFTKIEIIENLLGSQMQDTLIFLNGSGSMCLGSLENYELGQELVIRYELDRFYDPIVLESLEKSIGTKMEFISNDACTNWALRLIEEKVVGNIFRSKRAEEIQKMHNQIEHLSKEEIQDRYDEIRNIKQEEIGYVMLSLRLEEIENTLYNN